jgi:polysaccharide export outer membrane protein
MLALSGATTVQTAQAAGAQQPSSQHTTTADFAQVYRLGTGDQLRLIVYGEEDLSGEFTVDATGYVSLPLIGEVASSTLTLRELENSIAAKLRDGYIKNPRVNVEVITYRPFYIYGEVKEGGEYPFVAGMNVMKAVAMAGGYTYRANTKKVFITRLGRDERFSAAATQNTTIFPGDVIEVRERFF